MLSPNVDKPRNQGNPHPLWRRAPQRERPLSSPKPIRSANPFPTFPLTSCTVALPWSALLGEAGSCGEELSSFPLQPSWRRFSLVCMHGTKRLDFTDKLRCADVDPNHSPATPKALLWRYLLKFQFGLFALLQLTGGRNEIICAGDKNCNFNSQSAEFIW